MIRRTLASLALPMLLALTACSGADAPAPAATPAAPDAAAEPAPAPTTPAPAATDTAAAPAPAAATPAPTGAAPVAGVDFFEIPNGQPFQPQAGKIEVAEVFGYTCPHCADFEPVLNAWRQRQPADVVVTPVPAAFGGIWLPYARAFYAAESLGVLAQSHDAVFNAIHVQRTLPVNPNVKAEDIAPFYAQYGVDPKRFVDTYNSFGVDAKLNRARQFATRAKIEGTPSMVVAGRYTVPVDAQGFEKMLRTVDWLVARERGGAH